MARLLEEGFEGTGYENTGWVETVETGCTLDEDSTEKTPPSFGGSQTLKSDVLSVTYGNAYAKYTLTDQVISYVRTYIYVDAESFADNDTATLLTLTDSSFALVCSIQFRQVAGAYGLRFRYYSGSVANNTALVAINLDTLYLVEFKYDITNMLWEWKIDKISQHNGSLTSATRTPDRSRVGIQSAPNALTVFYDRVAWDDTEWCTANPLMMVGAGSIAITGTVAGLLKSSLVSAGAGAYVITGQDADLYRLRSIVAGSGIFVITGKDVSFLYTNLQELLSIIRKAFRMNSINTPTSTQINNGIMLFNDMISNWSLDGIIVPYIANETLPLTIGKSVYTIGEDGDFDTTRPIRIVSVYIRDVRNYDNPVYPITRWEYNAISDKSQTGIPSRLYYNPEYPLGKVCFDYSPDAAMTLYLKSEKVLTELSDIDAVLPLEYKEALIYNLAIRVSTEEDTTLSPIVVSIANISKNTIENLNAIDRLVNPLKIERMNREVRI